VVGWEGGAANPPPPLGEVKINTKTQGGGGGGGGGGGYRASVNASGRRHLWPLAPAGNQCIQEIEQRFFGRPACSVVVTWAALSRLPLRNTYNQINKPFVCLLNNIFQ